MNPTPPNLKRECLISLSVHLITIINQGMRNRQTAPNSHTPLEWTNRLIFNSY